MFNWIEKMRSEKESKKKIYAFSFALFIVGLIFIIWVSVWFPESLKNYKLKNKSFETPSDGIVKGFSELWNYGVNKINIIQKEFIELDFASESEYKNVKPE